MSIKAKMKRPILGIKKDQIVEIVKDNGDYCLCSFENSHVRIEKKHLEFIKN